MLTFDDPTIRSRTQLRHAIRDAETIAGRIEMPSHRLTLGEKRVIARLLRALAGVGRRAFDPEARDDWSADPVTPTEDSRAPFLFPEDAA